MPFWGPTPAKPGNPCQFATFGFIGKNGVAPGTRFVGKNKGDFPWRWWAPTSPRGMAGLPSVSFAAPEPSPSKKMFSMRGNPGLSDIPKAISPWGVAFVPKGWEVPSQTWLSGGRGGGRGSLATRGGATHFRHSSSVDAARVFCRRELTGGAPRHREIPATQNGMRHGSPAGKRPQHISRPPRFRWRGKGKKP